MSAIGDGPRSQRSLRAAATALALTIGLGSAASASRAERPNVVVILADDLGWGDVSCHDGTTPTPHIDRLFHDGTELTQFLVTPLCSPTRAGLMTGRHPARVGLAPFVVNPRTPATLRPEEVTLGEAFRSAGYDTACFGKWHLGFVYSTQSEGFDEFCGCMAGGVDYFNRGRPTNTAELDWLHNGKPCREEGYTTELIRDRAVRYIRQARDRPFFLYVPFTAVHNPLQAPEDYLKRVPPSIQDRDKRIYSAMISSLDDAVGAILAAIDERGIRDRTVVLFASDNGATPTGNNLPFRGGKHTPYEGGVRTPTAIRWPGHIPGGRKLDDMLVIEDAYPTLLSLAGVKRPKGPPLDGKDFAGLLTSTTKQRSARDTQYWLWRDCDVIRTPRWKMLRRTRTRELYDLEADPCESKNVAGDHPRLVGELEAKLDAWEASIPVYPSHVPVRLHAPAEAKPAGDVIEVHVRRDSGDADAFCPIILASSDLVLSPGDRVEYDVFVSDDSAPTGFFVDVIPRAREPDPFWWADAVDQHGTVQEASEGFPQARGRWARRVVGLANNAPMKFGVMRLAFAGRGRAEYHMYLDNLIVKRGSGEVIVLYQDGPLARRVHDAEGYPQVTVRSVPLASVDHRPGAEERGQ